MRARLCRAQSGAWYAGWVVHLAQNEARIRLQSFVSFQVNETFIGECYGDGTLVRFAGRIVAQAGQEVLIETTGSMTFEPSRGAVRLCVENVFGTLSDGNREANVIVLDISPASLGVLSDLPFVPSVSLGMSLQTPSGMYSATVGVANCRSSEGETGHYRIGLHILDTSRLDAAMWQRLLEDRASM